MAPETPDPIAELQQLIDEGFASGISSRSKDDIRALGLKKLAEANKNRIRTIKFQGISQIIQPYLIQMPL